MTSFDERALCNTCRNSADGSGSFVSGSPPVDRLTGLSLIPERLRAKCRPGYGANVLSAIDPETIKNLITAGSFVPLVIALVLFKFVVSTVVRSVLVVVALAVGVVLFTQRDAVDDCVDSVEQVGTNVSASCSILGFDVDIEI